MTLEENKTPIFHITTDEKFINAAHEIYEKAFPGENRFIVLMNMSQRKIKYINKCLNYIIVKTSDNYLRIILNQIQLAKIVIFHGMNFHQSQIALKINKKEKSLVWNVFGYEVYDNPYLFGKEIYGKETYKKYVFSIKSNLKNFLRPYYYQLIKHKEDPNLQKIRAFKRMDFVATIIDEEYELYKKLGIVSPNSQLINFTYYPLDIVIDKELDNIIGNNILIGNSASYTNNHIETFKLIKNFNLENRKIITPLSYGIQDYTQEIIKEGVKTFGYKLKPLTKFMEIHQYHTIIQSCEITIMNHYRQQAVGNIFSMLYMGSKIYLSEKNTVFHFLKRLNCYIYSIENDLKTHSIGNKKFYPLTNKQKEINKGNILSTLSLNRIVKELIKKLGPYL